jgi:hypothetical protein
VAVRLEQPTAPGSAFWAAADYRLYAATTDPKIFGLTTSLQISWPPTFRAAAFLYSCQKTNSHQTSKAVLLASHHVDPPATSPSLTNFGMIRELQPSSVDASLRFAMRRKSPKQ